jgi:hypothetical protein
VVSRPVFVFLRLIFRPVFAGLFVTHSQEQKRKKQERVRLTPPRPFCCKIKVAKLIKISSKLSSNADIISTSIKTFTRRKIMSKTKKTQILQLFVDAGMLEPATELLKRQQAFDRELRARNLMIASLLTAAGYQFEIRG